MQTERKKPKSKTRPSGTSRTKVDPVTRYALDVMNGRIVARPLVRLACKRHLDDLESGAERGLAWDPAAGLHVIGFFKDVLRLPDVVLVGHRMSSCSPPSPRICASLPSFDQIHLQLSN